MADESVGREGPRSVQRLALTLVITGIAVCAVVVALQVDVDSVNGLAVVLFVAALIGGGLVVPSLGRASITAGFLVLTLAAALLSPPSAALCALAGELSAAWRVRTPRSATLFNILS